MELLREWRRQEAAEQKLPAYCIFTDATLVALAEARPRTATELIKVQGLGPAKADKYGEQVLAILAAEASRRSRADSDRGREIHGRKVFAVYRDTSLSADYGPVHRSPV